jgi:hypothetical protein
MTKDFKLNERAHRWIAGIKAQFVGRPIQPAAPLIPSMPSPGAFKIL